jgi:hypothetical protein
MKSFTKIEPKQNYATMGRRIFILVTLVAVTASSTTLSSSTIDISVSPPPRLSKILYNLEGDSNNDNDEHDDDDTSNRATTVVRLDDDVDDEEESSLDTDYQLDYQRRHRDPFVNASPLSVAAVCRDGVALVSLHYDIDLPEKKKVDDSKEENDELEALSVIKALEETTAMEVTGSQTIDDNNINIRQSSLAEVSTYFRDLPPFTRGPLRIESVHDNKLRDNRAPSMALLTAGWRTDGIVLADAARTLMADEVRLFCPPSTMTLMSSSAVPRRNKSSSVAYTVPTSAMDRRIAKGLSYYLTKCASGNGGRSLSTVGLLVTACNSRGKGYGGSIHLIDTTGSYRVRAHAIGSRSDALHMRMTYVDFGVMDCEEGLRTLLCLIAEVDGIETKERAGDYRGGQGEGMTVAHTEEIETKRQLQIQQERSNAAPTGKTLNLSTGPVVELAVLRAADGKMKRVQLSSLFT